MRRKVLTAFFLIVLYYGVRIYNFPSWLKDSDAQCLSITDTSNNSNPTLSFNYSLTPSLGAAPTSNTHGVRIRTSAMSWRLQAARVGPNRTSGSGPTAHDISASDINYTGTLTGTMTTAGTATLISPFNAATTQASINTTNTPIIQGTARTAANCSTMGGTYWDLTVNESIYPDFIFNVGTYSGTISYILTAP